MLILSAPSFWEHTYTRLHSSFDPNKTCQSAGPCLGLYHLTSKKSFERSLIRGWTAVCGQRPGCLCGRTPANLAVECGWLPDFSGFLTGPPVHFSILLIVLLCQVRLPTCLTPLRPPSLSIFPFCWICQTRCLESVAINHIHLLSSRECVALSLT